MPNMLQQSANGVRVLGKIEFRKMVIATHATVKALALFYNHRNLAQVVAELEPIKTPIRHVSNAMVPVGRIPGLASKPAKFL